MKVKPFDSIKLAISSALGSGIKPARANIVDFMILEKKLKRNEDLSPRDLKTLRELLKSQS